MNMQLPLELSFKRNLDLDSFVPGANTECLSCLRGLGRGEGEKINYLWGKPGVGKTHLLRAMCREMSSAGYSVVYLPLREAIAWSPEMLDHLETYGLICLDDVQAIGAHPVWQEALFHLINRQLACDKHFLLLTGDQPVNGLPLQLPDLLSRLAWGVVYQVQELDDTGKAEAVQRKAAERGFELGDQVLEYLFRHYTRDLPAMLDLLDRVDQAALSEQRRITLPFVRRFLNQSPS